ncbi:uncharacterized protein LOC117648456 isoform X2 [Thrips palmi]|nr:uncharacterized protein LOC117648456 isoform X2 [Thrips palmi]
MFMMWGGCEINESTETTLHITFRPYHQGKLCDTYSVSFSKLGSVWTAAHFVLPHSIRSFRERVEEADLSSVHRLADFIRCLQHEVNLFIWRREQFNQAKSLVSPSLAIHPSVSTTEVQLICHVDDKAGSELSKAYIHLHYQSHKYLPVRIEIEFDAGSEEDKVEFIKQVSILNTMPLKDALITAFTSNTSTEMPLESNTGPLPETKAPAVERESTQAWYSGRQRSSSSGSAKENERRRPPTKAELKHFRSDSSIPFMSRPNDRNPKRRPRKPRNFDQSHPVK